METQDFVVLLSTDTAYRVFFPAVAMLKPIMKGVAL